MYFGFRVEILDGSGEKCAASFGIRDPRGRRIIEVKTGLAFGNNKALSHRYLEPVKRLVFPDQIMFLVWTVFLIIS